MSENPIDGNGVHLKPFDIVLIDEVPDHYWSDKNFFHLREYSKSFGMVSYYRHQKYYYGKKDHLGWVTPDGGHVNVRCLRVTDESIASYSFWLPCKSLTKLDFNIVILAAFADLPITLDALDDGTEEGVLSGTEMYDNIAKILRCQYSQLREANFAAISILDKFNGNSS
jgi:hypothetical protein